ELNEVVGIGAGGAGRARLLTAWTTGAAKDRIDTARRYEACSCRQTIRADDRSGRRGVIPKRAGRSLEVLTLNCERQTRSLGQRQTHRPEFEVNLVYLAWLARLTVRNKRRHSQIRA